MTTTGFKNSVGVDIGTLFDPYVSGTQATATGYLDLLGNDLSTRFAPYVSGSQSATTGYTITSGSDLNTVFAPPAPAFPTLQSSVINISGIGIGNYTCVYLDGSNMVMCCQGALPAENTYTYLYWSDNYASTLNRATINGSSTNKFFGCVAISGANAVAMGRLTSASGTIVCYVSSDYGKTYVTASGSVSGTPGAITMSGAVALRWAYTEAVYRSTDYGNTWTSLGGFGGVINAKIYGNNAYICSANFGLYYSTNAGLTFTRSTSHTAQIYSVTMVGTTLYIGGYNVIYKSTNYGVNISTITSLVNPRTVTSITSCPATNGDFVWVGNEDTSTNYYSNNSGISWTTVTNGAAKPFLSWATATRMITGVGSATAGGLYWGRNAYII